MFNLRHSALRLTSEITTLYSLSSKSYYVIRTPDIIVSCLFLSAHVGTLSTHVYRVCSRINLSSRSCSRNNNLLL